MTLNKQDTFTVKQRKYINLRTQGYEKSEAYLEAYDVNTTNVHTISNNAYMLENTPKIRNEIQRINKEIEAKIIECQILNETDRKLKLSEIINVPLKEDQVFTTHIIAAIRELNDMENIGKKEEKDLNINVVFMSNVPRPEYIEGNTKLLEVKEED